MNDYGITPHGFEIKPFTRILEDKAVRAREMFGTDVDLRSTSVLRKLLDLASYEDHELWKRLETFYYGQFMSTASGDALDLLAEDVGIERRFLAARGKVLLSLSGEAPDRTYHVPLGALLETEAPVRGFRTLERVSLSAAAKEAEVEVEARRRGPEGNVAAGAIARVNAVYAGRYLRLGSATVAVTNPAATAGGDVVESDQEFRDALLGHPRTLWTLEAVRAAVKAVDGVRDCRLLDPGGGVDVSLSKFGVFAYGQRRFGSQRYFGSPYRFDVLVATRPGIVWESLGDAPGLSEEVSAALDRVRPISIYPNLRRANHVRVGLRARLRIAGGHDHHAIAAAIRERLERRVNTLGLGRSVLYAEVLTDVMAVTGVVDVNPLRLRRCPPLWNRVSFGRRGRFQGAVVELPVGENLELEADEIAELAPETELIDLDMSDR